MKSGHLLIGWCFSDLALFGCLAIEPVGTMGFVGIFVGAAVYLVRTIPRDGES